MKWMAIWRPTMVAGSGAPAAGWNLKPLRIFNPFTQASKFDPDANYIRRWLPELAHINTKDLISGDIGALERRGWPLEPIVNHSNSRRALRRCMRHCPVD